MKKIIITITTILVIISMIILTEMVMEPIVSDQEIENYNQQNNK